jgi:hypothetical protein
MICDERKCHLARRLSSVDVAWFWPVRLCVRAEKCRTESENTVDFVLLQRGPKEQREKRMRDVPLTKQGIRESGN